MAQELERVPLAVMAREGGCIGCIGFGGALLGVVTFLAGGR